MQHRNLEGRADYGILVYQIVSVERTLGFVKAEASLLYTLAHSCVMSWRIGQCVYSATDDEILGVHA